MSEFVPGTPVVTDTTAGRVRGIVIDNYPDSAQWFVITESFQDEMWAHSVTSIDPDGPVFDWVKAPGMVQLPEPAECTQWVLFPKSIKALLRLDLGSLSEEDVDGNLHDMVNLVRHHNPELLEPPITVGAWVEMSGAYTWRTIAEAGPGHVICARIEDVHGDSDSGLHVDTFERSRLSIVDAPENAAELLALLGVTESQEQ